MRIIRISTCSECPHSSYDRGYDAIFCEEPGLPKAIKLSKSSDWKDFKGVHDSCPLVEEEDIVQVEVGW